MGQPRKLGAKSEDRAKCPKKCPAHAHNVQMRWQMRAMRNRMCSHLEVGSLDAHSLSRGDDTGEHTSESIEASLLAGRHHLRDVHAQGSVGVARADTVGDRVIHGSGVQVLHAVTLGHGRRRQMVAHHLQQGLAAGSHSDNKEYSDTHAETDQPSIQRKENVKTSRSNALVALLA